jgi:hypothetical protein
MFSFVHIGTEASQGTASRAARILLARRFDPSQDPETQQYGGADYDPVRGYVHDDGPVNQSSD